MTVAQADLTADNAAVEIDRLIGVALLEHRPVYLMLPSDVAQAPLSAKPAPLMLRQAKLSRSVAGIYRRSARKLLPARRVSLLADFLVDRFGAEAALDEWLQAVDIPHATLLLGKGVLDENRAGFVGTYCGGASDPAVKQLIENADVVINVGVRLTDTITAGFTHHLPVEKCIDIQPFEAWVGRQRFSRIPMREAVQALHRLSLSLASRWPLPPIVRPTLPETDGEGLDQHAFWRQIQDFLRPGYRAGRSGHRLFRRGGVDVAAWLPPDRAGAMGIDRLYPAGDVRRTDRRTAAAGNIADRRRRRAADRTGTGIDAARRA